MVKEFAAWPSTQESGEEKAGLDRTSARGRPAEWQRIFTDLVAEIA
jgi:hypothetical protein